MVIAGLMFMLWVPPLKPAATSADVVRLLEGADDRRLSALAGYTGLRRYRFENKRFNVRAEMTVRVTCSESGVKTFQVLAQDGPGVIRGRVIQKMIDAEHEASAQGAREQSRIISRNYDFRLVGTEVQNGRYTYILEISPKTSDRFLVRGRIWVDAEDFAITRVEGSPARSPSFWVRSSSITQEYSKQGRFWLPSVNHSRAEARVFGPTEVDIDYFDYTITETRAADVKHR
jgi:hypothetical protein